MIGDKYIKNKNNMILNFHCFYCGDRLPRMYELYHMKDIREDDATIYLFFKKLWFNELVFKDYITYDLINNNNCSYADKYEIITNKKL